MVGSIIGGALKLGSAVTGGILGVQSAKKQKQMLEAQQRENQDWYNKRYNEDATQRADAQRMLTATAEAIKQRNKSMAGRSAVMGGNDESIAQEKALNAQAMADATSGIVALGEARKDDIEQKYMARDQALDQAFLDNEKARSQAIVGAVQGAVEAGSSIASAFMKS